MESPLCPPADPGFCLIETFGYVPGQGAVRLEMHLARMARSALALGMAFDAGQARALADDIDGQAALRCRMTLDVAGKMALTTAAMPEAQSHWHIGIAPVRLSSADFWLQHKSSRRQVYDAARAGLPDGVDELIFLNERDELCEGTISNIFVQLPDGAHVTPPVACGLLPGVLRQQYLAQSRVRERVLNLEDLRRARAISLGNSLRGMVRAVLV